MKKLIYTIPIHILSFYLVVFLADKGLNWEVNSNLPEWIAIGTLILFLLVTSVIIMGLNISLYHKELDK